MTLDIACYDTGYYLWQKIFPMAKNISNGKQYFLHLYYMYQWHTILPIPLECNKTKIVLLSRLTVLCVVHMI